MAEAKIIKQSGISLIRKYKKENPAPLRCHKTIAIALSCKTSPEKRVPKTLAKALTCYSYLLFTTSDLESDDDRDNLVELMKIICGFQKPPKNINQKINDFIASICKYQSKFKIESLTKKR